MEGYIYIHKRILDWEWYDDASTVRLFLHLLLRASYKEGEWHGQKIAPGQIITSYGHLASELGIGVQSIRTSINRLKSTGELTNRTTNKYSIITISKWLQYQRPTSELTNNQQTTNKQLTTSKEVKEYKEEKNITKSNAKSGTFGNKNINILIQYLEEAIKGSLDGSQQENRRYLYLLLNRFRKDYPTRNEVEIVRFLISRGLEDRFHAKNITNFKYLYYNAMKIIQSVKADMNKNTITKIS